jgi:hypothetical protein
MIVLLLWLAFFVWVVSSVSAVRDKARTDGLPAPDTDKYYMDMSMGLLAFILLIPEDFPPNGERHWVVETNERRVPDVTIAVCDPPRRTLLLRLLKGAVVAVLCSLCGLQ